MMPCSRLTETQKFQRLHVQLTFTCSNSAIETLEKGVRYVQSKQQKHQNGATVVVLVFLFLTFNIFHVFFFSASIADFEQVNVSLLRG